MNLPNIVFFIPPELPSTGIFLYTKFPYVMGRLITFEDQDEIGEYVNRSRAFYLKRIEGYNIFLAPAGFLIKPTDQISDKVINEIVDKMADWYLLNVLLNNRRKSKRYLIK